MIAQHTLRQMIPTCVMTNVQAHTQREVLMNVSASVINQVKSALRSVKSIIIKKVNA